MSIATKTGEWSNVHRLRRTSRKPRRSGLSKAARETLRQKPSRAERAASAPPLAWPSTSTAAFIAPADVPEMPSICSQRSSSRRSRAPQVKAPCAPPPCSARSTRKGSRLEVSALLVATGVGSLGFKTEGLRGRMHHASVRKPGPARRCLLLDCNTTCDYSQDSRPPDVHLIMQEKIRWPLSVVVIRSRLFCEKWSALPIGPVRERCRKLQYNM